MFCRKDKNCFLFAFYLPCRRVYLFYLCDLSTRKIETVDNALVRRHHLNTAPECAECSRRKIAGRAFEIKRDKTARQDCARHMLSFCELQIYLFILYRRTKTVDA